MRLTLAALFALVCASPAFACDDEAKAEAAGASDFKSYQATRVIPNAIGQEGSLKVGGMKCGGCAKHVTKALEGAGFANVQVDVKKGQAKFICAQGSACDMSKAMAEISKAGYKPVAR